jgi:hypothetical protein
VINTPPQVLFSAKIVTKYGTAPASAPLKIFALSKTKHILYKN